MAKKNLITIDDYKSYKGINSDTDDNKISSTIASVSDFVKSYCNRSFVDFIGTDKTEYPELMSDTRAVYLLEYPIISVTSLSVSTDSHITYTTLIENVDFVVDKSSGVIHRVDGKYFEDSFRSVSVVYKGGLDPLDESLKLACIDLTSYFLNKEYKPKMSTSTSIRENFSSGEIPTRLPAHIQNTLMLFKN